MSSNAGNEFSNYENLMKQTVLMMTKNTLADDKFSKASLSATIGLTIDSERSVVISVNELLESNPVRMAREAKEKLEAEQEKKRKHDELEAEVETRVRKRQAELSSIGLNATAKRIKSENDDDGASVSSNAIGGIGLNAGATEDDADIKVEKDGVSAVYFLF